MNTNAHQDADLREETERSPETRALLDAAARLLYAAAARHAAQYWGYTIPTPSDAGSFALQALARATAQLAVTDTLRVRARQACFRISPQVHAITGEALKIPRGTVFVAAEYDAVVQQAGGALERELEYVPIEWPYAQEGAEEVQREAAKRSLVRAEDTWFQHVQPLVVLEALAAADEVPVAWPNVFALNKMAQELGEEHARKAA
ncbi:MAG: hypothetical protein AAFU51_10300 [Bacteroidota bacterium]